MGGIEFEGGTIGATESTFVIAEAGSNHNGDLDLAKELVDVAADAGADAVKFQTYEADRVYVDNSGQAEYLDDERPLRDILADLEMPKEWIPELHEYANSRDILFLSTPADRPSADALDPYVPLFKVESFMLSHHPFLDYLARKGKPLILSTGAHDFAEVEEAVEFLQENGVEEFVLLHCVSAYPTALEDVNVRVLTQFSEAFDVPVGLSDHTMDPVTAPTTAVALGASVVEKHFTLDRTLDGPDHEFALEPDELDEMVTAIRKTETAMGEANKRVLDSERELQDKVRRSVQTTDAIEAGETLTRENIDVLAPGERTRGLDPKMYDSLLGKTAANAIEKGEGVTWEDVN